MSKPKYVKDSKQFKVVFQDVFRYVVNGSGMGREIGIVANRQINACIEKFTENGIDYMSLYFSQKKRDDEEGEDMIKEVEAEIVLTVEGKDQIVTRIGKGKCTLQSGIGLGYTWWRKLNTILDESNGYLKDEALILHIEIRIDCLIGKDGIRRFNFHDPFENAIRIAGENWDSDLYCPKCIFLHHCKHPLFRNLRDNIKLSSKIGNRKTKPDADTFLQILNGVRLWDLDTDEAFSLLFFGICLKADTVIRFSEEWMTRNVPNEFKIDQLTGTHSKCLLKWVLKDPVDRGTVYDIAECMQSLNEEAMKTEHMKTLVKKMFSFV